MFTPIHERGQRHRVHAIGQAAPAEAASGSLLNQFGMILSIRHDLKEAREGFAQRRRRQLMSVRHIGEGDRVFAFTHAMPSIRARGRESIHAASSSERHAVQVAPSFTGLGKSGSLREYS